MMRVWVVYSERTLENKTHAFDMMLEGASRVGMEAEVLFVERLKVCDEAVFYEERQRGLPDCVVMRCYHETVSRAFEQRGIRVINSTESMRLSLDKMKTYDALVACALSTPFSVDLRPEKYGYDQLAARFFSARFVVKAAKGAKGAQVFVVDGRESLAAAVEACNGDCLAQRLVETSYGRDVRVWVIGGKVVGAVERYNEMAFVSNVSAGGKVRSVTVTPEIEALAVKGTLALGLHFSGVDLLYDGDSFSICEINGNAGFRSLYSLFGTHVPELLFRSIYSLFVRNAEGF